MGARDDPSQRPSCMVGGSERVAAAFKRSSPCSPPVLTLWRDDRALGPKGVVGMQQQGEHRARFGAAHDHAGAVYGELERVDGPELHHLTARRLPRRRAR